MGLRVIVDCRAGTEGLRPLRAAIAVAGDLQVQAVAGLELADKGFVEGGPYPAGPVSPWRLVASFLPQFYPAPIDGAAVYAHDFAPDPEKAIPMLHRA